MSEDSYPEPPSAPDPGEYSAHENALHEQIIGSFCHDLRQPLNAALMRLASLKRAYTTGHDRELLEELHLNLREISNMSETVFDAIRLSRASIRPNPGAVSIQDLFEHVRSEFASLAEQKGLRLAVSPSPYLVVTDEMLLARILTNLVHNALNYTREGGVLVAARRVAGQFSLEVWDTGPGIGANEIEKIFTPFYRGGGEREQTGASGNSGIGLWNGREFARLLGGSLTVASRPGRGSVFRLRLPVAMENMPSAERRSDPASGSGRSLIALLTSDPAVLIEQQRLVLARGDTHVSFTDPLQLLAYLNVPLNRPDALLIDLSAGPVNADFLMGILSVRYPELSVGVLAEDPTDTVSVAVSRQGARVIAKPLLASNLDGFLRGRPGESLRPVLLEAKADSPAISATPVPTAGVTGIPGDNATVARTSRGTRDKVGAANKPTQPIT